jgi:hypothetical protein
MPHPVSQELCRWPHCSAFRGRHLLRTPSGLSGAPRSGVLWAGAHFLFTRTFPSYPQGVELTMGLNGLVAQNHAVLLFWFQYLCRKLLRFLTQNTLFSDSHKNVELRANLPH